MANHSQNSRSHLAALTAENYRSGFLVRGTLMAGVAEDASSGCFLSYIMNSETAEYLGCHRYSSLEEALAGVARATPGWSFEAMSECSGSCSAGEGGSCSKHSV